MAAIHATTRSILSSFLPRLSPSTATATTRFTTLYSRQLSHPLLPALGFALPSAIQLNVPEILEGLWESILKAVPKKKTSHMKKRHRQMAGKGMKDVTALNFCPACGNVKRAHLLCPHCVHELRQFFNRNNPDSRTGGRHHLPGEKLVVKGAFLIRKDPLPMSEAEREEKKARKLEMREERKAKQLERVEEKKRQAAGGGASEEA